MDRFLGTLAQIAFSCIFGMLRHAFRCYDMGPGAFPSSRLDIIIVLVMLSDAFRCLQTFHQTSHAKNTFHRTSHAKKTCARNCKARLNRMTMMAMRMKKMLKMTMMTMMMVVAMAAAPGPAAAVASAHPAWQSEQARRAALVGAARRAMH